MEKLQLSENSMQQKMLQHELFVTIADICRKHHLEAYVIGGFVRDYFLKRPSKDIDIVVNGDGISVARELASVLNGEFAYFKNFGTAMVKTGEYEIEFVNARKESYSRHSRKPHVEKGTLKDDQLRRDFTINTLAFSLNQADYGNLIDPFNGLQDLHDGIIRTPGDPIITFSDDPLRMMRAIRFATQLKFIIDEPALNAIKQESDRIKIVSKERIADELHKIILCEKPSSGFLLLSQTGILDKIFPALTKLKGVEIKNGKGHKDNFYHTLEVLDNISKVTQNLWLRWAALLHDIAKPDTKRFDAEHGWTFHGHEDKGARMVPQIFRELKLPLNDKMKYVQKLVFLHLRPIVLAQEVVTDSAVRRLLFDAGDDIDDLMILCQADVTTKNEYKKQRYRNNFELVKKKLLEVEEKDRIRNWQPPVTGQLIMDTFGIGPGPLVGQIKDFVREAILDGTCANTYDEAFQLMLKKGHELGLNPEG
jgi:putative nucleotidyltransferase with HDIG domain